jgi:copper chaperone CopZ
VVLNSLRLRRVRLLPHSNNTKEQGETDMLFAKNKSYDIKIEGMMCQHCVAHVKKALESVKGVKNVTVSLETNSATVETTAASKLLSAAITDAGYTVTEISEISH